MIVALKLIGLEANFSTGRLMSTEEPTDIFPPGDDDAMDKINQNRPRDSNEKDRKGKEKEAKEKDKTKLKEKEDKDRNGHKPSDSKEDKRTSRKNGAYIFFKIKCSVISNHKKRRQ